MGTDGREVRRYLLGDPLNPVSAGQAALLPVWPKLLLFYAVLTGVAWVRPASAEGPRIAARVHRGFGARRRAWGRVERRRGGAIPRPFSLPAASRDLGRVVGRPGAAPRSVIAVGAFSLLWLSNVWAFNPWIARARSARAEALLGCVGSMLDARSVIIVPDQADPLVSFTRDRLDEPPRSVGANVIYLSPPRAEPGLTWEGTLSSAATRALGSGGRVWVPAYALDSIPPRSVGWVEGAQPVTWAQVRQAFGALALRHSCDPTATA